MDLKTIIEAEKVHLETKETYNTIHLYCVNEKFFRAFNFSAWLGSVFMPLLQPTKNNVKYETDIDQTIAYIGFPTTSLSKFTPKETLTDFPAPDHVVLTLKTELITQTFIAEAKENYKNWKNSIQIKKKVSSSKTLKHFLESNDINTIIDEILKYPTESSTLIENTIFLAEIKKKILQIEKNNQI